MKVLLIQAAAIGVSLSNIEIALKIVSWTVAIGYALWRWYKDYKKDKRENPNG